MLRLSNHLSLYRSCFNLSYIFVSGFMVIFLIVLQLFSGICIALGISNCSCLFTSLHSLVASLLILFAYFHIYKNLFYKVDLGSSSFIVYITGWFLFLFLLCICFTGYILPWGQISFWGIKVISSLFEIIPGLGSNIKEFIWGDIILSREVTHSRFLSLHIILGSFIWVFVLIHIIAAHSKKSITYPVMSLESTFRTSSLYPLTYVKDFFILFLIIFFICIYIVAGNNFFKESSNLLEVDIFSTPLEMMPEWYFLPSFSVLKHIESKILGIFLAILINFTMFIPLVRSLLFGYSYRIINKDRLKF